MLPIKSTFISDDANVKNLGKRLTQLRLAHDAGENEKFHDDYPFDWAAE